MLIKNIRMPASPRSTTTPPRPRPGSRHVRPGLPPGARPARTLLPTIKKHG